MIDDNRQAASVIDAFERALGEIRTRVCVSAPSAEADARHESIAIAYSGGLDSAVLLHIAHDYARRHGIALHAFHVHHGISLNADDWLAHCRSECERRDIAFDARRIELDRHDGQSLEEAARIGRYAALGEMCRLHGVPLLLTAHHQDDQAETVLLQLLRGSGVAGLSGMEAFNAAPGLLGDPDLIMARPLLPLSRAELAGFASEKRIAYIEDESNTDPRYARNALRHQVMPVLEACFPGFRQRIARTARHAQSAHRLLHEMGAQDLAGCMEGNSISIDRLKLLSPERIDNALRYWFVSRGIRMPSTSWLTEMRTQLLEAREDARVCVTHPDCHIRRHRDRIFLTRRREADAPVVTQASFRWNGESRIAFPAFGGSLYFDAAEEGVDAGWLRAQPLRIHYRSGGERLKPAWNRPTRSLKQHYQALDIPAWEREELPLVSASEDLIFAAGIGMDCHHFSAIAEVHIRLRWQGDNDDVPPPKDASGV